MATLGNMQLNGMQFVCGSVSPSDGGLTVTIQTRLLEVIAFGVSLNDLPTASANTAFIASAEAGSNAGEIDVIFYEDDGTPLTTTGNDTSVDFRWWAYGRARAGKNYGTLTKSQITPTAGTDVTEA